MSTDLREVRFDPKKAQPIYPRPLVKNAVFVPIPLTADGAEIPTFIWPEWGSVQVFYGGYYAIVHNGRVIYGSAKDQWEAMHTSIHPGYWVKTAIPEAYQATKRCRIVTIIPSDDGGVREASVVVNSGDWVVRQPGGEIQRILANKFSNLYFSKEEAEALGLTRLSADQFARWAIGQALKSLQVG